MWAWQSPSPVQSQSPEPRAKPEPRARARAQSPSQSQSKSRYSVRIETTGRRARHAAGSRSHEGDADEPRGPTRRGRVRGLLVESACSGGNGDAPRARYDAASASTTPRRRPSAASSRGRADRDAHAVLAREPAHQWRSSVDPHRAEEQGDADASRQELVNEVRAMDRATIRSSVHVEDGRAASSAGSRAARRRDVAGSQDDARGFSSSAAHAHPLERVAGDGRMGMYTAASADRRAPGATCHHARIVYQPAVGATARRALPSCAPSRRSFQYRRRRRGARSAVQGALPVRALEVRPATRGMPIAWK